MTNFPGVVALANVAQGLGLFEDLDRLPAPKERDRGLANSAAVFDLMCIPLSGAQRITSCVKRRTEQGRHIMAGAAGVGAAGAGAAAAAIARAIKASGAIVNVGPPAFQDILDRQPEAPLVVEAEGGFFSTNCQYLTSYKGLIFFTKSPVRLALPEDCEIVVVAKIWIPQ